MNVAWRLSSRAMNMYKITYTVLCEWRTTNMNWIRHYATRFSVLVIWRSHRKYYYYILSYCWVMAMAPDRTYNKLLCQFNELQNVFDVKFMHRSSSASSSRNCSPGLRQFIPTGLFRWKTERLAAIYLVVSAFVQPCSREYTSHPRSEIHIRFLLANCVHSR